MGLLLLQHTETSKTKRLLWFYESRGLYDKPSNNSHYVTLHKQHISFVASIISILCDAVLNIACFFGYLFRITNELFRVTVA